MTIKTATQLAIIGVALGILTAIAYHVVQFLPSDLSTHQQVAERAFWWGQVRSVGQTIALAGVLLFLVVLQSKQKDNKS